MKHNGTSLVFTALFFMLVGCATPQSEIKTGAGTKQIRALVTNLPGKSKNHNYSAHAVATDRNIFGQRTYTTLSVQSGTQPLSSKPNILLSDTYAEGIRVKFYASEDSKALQEQSIKLAKSYIEALGQMRNQLWPTDPPFTFTYDLRLIGWQDQIDSQVTHVFNKNDLEFTFYVRASPIENGDFSLVQTLSHETFHLMVQFFPNAKKESINGYTKNQKRMIGEGAASIFGHCIALASNGRIGLYDNLINTVTNANDSKESRIGSYNDHMLTKFLEPGFEIDKDHARTIFGPMIFTTLWAEYAGQAEVIKAGEPAAKKFMDLCENHIWPPENLTPVLQEMASDGVDPPQLRTKGKKKQTH